MEAPWARPAFRRRGRRGPTMLATDQQWALIEPLLPPDRRRYQPLILEACCGEDGEKIFLDLFTREGIEQCLQALTDDGVLCVHTSHRFLDLPSVLARIAGELGLATRRG